MSVSLVGAQVTCDGNPCLQLTNHIFLSCLAQKNKPNVELSKDIQIHNRKGFSCIAFPLNLNSYDTAKHAINSVHVGHAVPTA